MLEGMRRLVEWHTDEDLIVEVAHLELASPTVLEGVTRCVGRGATEIVVQPYMLALGRHAAEDLPRLAALAARSHPEVVIRVSPPLGVHPLLAVVALERSGLPVVRRAGPPGALGGNDA